MANYIVTDAGKLWKTVTADGPSGVIRDLKINDKLTATNLNNGFLQVSSVNGSLISGFCKSGIAKLIPPPPPPDTNTIVLPEYLTAHDAVGNVLGFYDLRKTS